MSRIKKTDVNAEVEWRPFEPCLENVEASLLEYAPYRLLVESREGLAYQSHDFTQEEARLTARLTVDMMKKFDTGGEV